jgi:divalent metal cation (Fe/Co/Zn/Cd) transporter
VPKRSELLRRALGLELLTVIWNVLEAAIGIAAAVGTGSIALLAFGVDSLVETASGSILIWRLTAERRAREAEEVDRLDRRARRLVGLSLFALALYVGIEAVFSLASRERPDPSWVGIVLTAVSLVLMRALARAKRSAARQLGSRALEADSFQTDACFWLSAITLSGVGLNAAFGWWWADPLAALSMTYFIAREGIEAWRGEDDA